MHSQAFEHRSPNGRKEHFRPLFYYEGMRIDVALRPQDLTERHLLDHSVIAFDVLRATTTMLAALAAGVREIHIFGDVESARAAGGAAGGNAILCGEERCLPPSGFSLGNSPAGFGALHRGGRVFMSTTNGTRAILAARSAPTVLVGAVVNARAAAAAAAGLRRDLTLLCAGTGGDAAVEDLLGAGAVITELRGCVEVELVSDIALMAESIFLANREHLGLLMRAGRGGRNVIAAGLESDIDFSARPNVIDLVGIASSGADDGTVVREFDRRWLQANG